MKVAIIITLILISSITQVDSTCNLSVNLGYSDILTNLLIDCFPGYKEIYGYLNGSPKLFGFPEHVPNAKPDLEIPFSVYIGHITITDVDENLINFYTNQHLTIRDYPFIIFIYGLILSVPLFIGNYFRKRFRLANRYEWINNLALSLAILLGGIYYVPLISFSPTPFRNIEFASTLKNCEILEIPEVSLEFSLTGILNFEHFIFINDWVYLRCPRSSVIDKSVLERDLNENIRYISTNETKNMGIVHQASDHWIKSRKGDDTHIREKSKELVKYHNRVWEEIDNLCRRKLCWWGGNVIDETDHYYLLNSTLLRGHSGLPCRDNHNSTTFFGIVQGYHSGRGYNICTKVTNTDSSKIWIIFLILPILFILTIKYISFAATRYYGLLLLSIFILAIGLVKDKIYI